MTPDEMRAHGERNSSTIIGIFTVWAIAAEFCERWDQQIKQQKKQTEVMERIEVVLSEAFTLVTDHLSNMAQPSRKGRQ